MPIARPCSCCLSLWLFGLVLSAVSASAAPPDSTETRHFAIEVAGIRVGTMTARRQPLPDRTLLYTLNSDVKVNLLVYRLHVSYTVRSVFRDGMLVSSIVNAHTNRGDFSSRTEWKDDHYDIVAEQYRHTRRATEPRRIDFTLTTVFFAEPKGRSQLYSEYFGDYFAVTRPSTGRYLTRLADREDEYVYENGQLKKIIKKNSLKNFIIRPAR